jgi:hypothetical protein
LIAACLVGAAALFRWIEIKYGLFQAFGAVGALLLVIAGVCAAVAASKLKPRTPHFPSLASRLRVAIHANPIGSGQIETAKDTARDNAAAMLREPSAPVTDGLKGRPRRDHGDLRAGLILMATLVGWAAVKRLQQARRSAP